MTYFLVSLTYCWPLFKKNATLQMIFLIPFWKNTERALISLLLGAMLGTCWDARGQKLWVKLPSKLSEKSALNIFYLFHAILWGHYWMEFLVLYLHKKCWLRAELAAPGHQGGLRQGGSGALLGGWGLCGHMLGPTLCREGIFTAAHPTWRCEAVWTDNQIASYPPHDLLKQIINWLVLL